MPQRRPTPEAAYPIASPAPASSARREMVESMDPPPPGRYYRSLRETVRSAEVEPSLAEVRPEPLERVVPLARDQIQVAARIVEAARRELPGARARAALRGAAHQSRA